MTQTTLSLAAARRLVELAQSPDRLLRWSRRSRLELLRRALRLSAAALGGTLEIESILPPQQTAAELKIFRACRVLVFALREAQYLSYDELLDRDLPVA